MSESSEEEGTGYDDEDSEGGGSSSSSGESGEESTEMNDEEAESEEEEETGVTETGASETGASETGATETGVTETGATETGASETGASETGVTETGATETGVSETGASETVVSETGASETGVSETVVSETGASETGVSETNATETGVSETEATEAGAAETDTDKSEALETETAVSGTEATGAEETETEVTEKTRKSAKSKGSSRKTGSTGLTRKTGSTGLTSKSGSTVSSRKTGKTGKTGSTKKSGSKVMTELTESSGKTGMPGSTEMPGSKEMTGSTGMAGSADKTELTTGKIGTTEPTEVTGSGSATGKTEITKSPGSIVIIESTGMTGSTGSALKKELTIENIGQTGMTESTKMTGLTGSTEMAEPARNTELTTGLIESNETTGSMRRSAGVTGSTEMIGKTELTTGKTEVSISTPQKTESTTGKTEVYISTPPEETGLTPIANLGLAEMTGSTGMTGSMRMTGSTGMTSAGLTGGTGPKTGSSGMTESIRKTESTTGKTEVCISAPLEKTGLTPMTNLGWPGMTESTGMTGSMRMTGSTGMTWSTGLAGKIGSKTGSESTGSIIRKTGSATRKTGSIGKASTEKEGTEETGTYMEETSMEKSDTESGMTNTKARKGRRSTSHVKFLQEARSKEKQLGRMLYEDGVRGSHDGIDLRRKSIGSATGKTWSTGSVTGKTGSTGSMTRKTESTGSMTRKTESIGSSTGKRQKMVERMLYAVGARRLQQKDDLQREWTRSPTGKTGSAGSMTRKTGSTGSMTRKTGSTGSMTRKTGSTESLTKRGQKMVERMLYEDGARGQHEKDDLQRELTRPVTGRTELTGSMTRKTGLSGSMTKKTRSTGSSTKREQKMVERMLYEDGAQWQHKKDDLQREWTRSVTGKTRSTGSMTGKTGLTGSSTKKTGLTGSSTKKTGSTGSSTKKTQITAERMLYEDGARGQQENNDLQRESTRSPTRKTMKAEKTGLRRSLSGSITGSTEMMVSMARKAGPTGRARLTEKLEVTKGTEEKSETEIEGTLMEKTDTKSGTTYETKTTESSNARKERMESGVKFLNWVRQKKIKKSESDEKQLVRMLYEDTARQQQSKGAARQQPSEDVARQQQNYGNWQSDQLSVQPGGSEGSSQNFVERKEDMLYNSAGALWGKHLEGEHSLYVQPGKGEEENAAGALQQHKKMDAHNLFWTVDVQPNKKKEAVFKYAGAFGALQQQHEKAEQLLHSVNTQKEILDNFDEVIEELQRRRSTLHGRVDQLLQCVNEVCRPEKQARGWSQEGSKNKGGLQNVLLGNQAMKESKSDRVVFQRKNKSLELAPQVLSWEEKRRSLETDEAIRRLKRKMLEGRAPPKFLSRLRPPQQKEISKSYDNESPWLMEEVPQFEDHRPWEKTWEIEKQLQQFNEEVRSFQRRLSSPSQCVPYQREEVVPCQEVVSCQEVVPCQREEVLPYQEVVPCLEVVPCQGEVVVPQSPRSDTGEYVLKEQSLLKRPWWKRKISDSVLCRPWWRRKQEVSLQENECQECEKQLSPCVKEMKIHEEEVKEQYESKVDCLLYRLEELRLENEMQLQRIRDNKFRGNNSCPCLLQESGECPGIQCPMPCTSGVNFVSEECVRERAPSALSLLYRRAKSM